MTTRATALATGLLLFGAGCASSNPVDENRKLLEQGMGFFDEGELQPAAKTMNDLLVGTQDDASAHALQRFYALYLLSQIHAAASLDEGFWTESSRATSRIGGIGQRDKGARGDQRPSETGHLIASIYHASLARTLYDRAARSGPKKGGATLLPESLWSLGVDNSDANLQVVMTSAYARLGFWAEVEKTLESSPTLLTLESATTYLEDYEVQSGLRPAVCAMISRFLRSTNEEEAYRFAIAAIEGRERFGAPLDSLTVAELEDWILNGASVEFVCPDSQTRYLPGQTRSQVSGTPHMDYIAVERLD